LSRRNGHASQGTCRVGVDGTLGCITPGPKIRLDYVFVKCAARQFRALDLMNIAMPCDLRDARILLIEQQPVVAADIEDRLAEAGALAIAIFGDAKKEFDPRNYDVLIVNASQQREEARRLVRLAAHAGCKVIILHDDIAKASTLFPGTPVVEIPFDSQEVLAAVCRSLGQLEKL